MDEFQVNFPGGDFRSGELNMEGAIPSVGVMRGASTSAARAGAALHNATARIVEIGGQFDTQSMAASQGDMQPTAADTAEGWAACACCAIPRAACAGASYWIQRQQQWPTGQWPANCAEFTRPAYWVGIRGWVIHWDPPRSIIRNSHRCQGGPWAGAERDAVNETATEAACS